MAAAIRVDTVARVELILAVGIPVNIIVDGAESVRDGARMLELLQPILDAVDASAAAAAAMDDDDGDGDGDGDGDDDADAAAWNVTHVDELRAVSTLAGHLRQLADNIIPALENHPADPDLLREVNTAAKDIRRAGKVLVAYGLAGPGHAGSMATALGNKGHKLVSRAFNWKSGHPRSAVDRAAYLTTQLPGLLVDVNQVLDGALVFF